MTTPDLTHWIADRLVSIGTKHQPLLPPQYIAGYRKCLTDLRNFLDLPREIPAPDKHRRRAYNRLCGAR